MKTVASKAGQLAHALPHLGAQELQDFASSVLEQKAVVKSDARGYDGICVRRSLAAVPPPAATPGPEKKGRSPASTLKSLATASQETGALGFKLAQTGGALGEHLLSLLPMLCHDSDASACHVAVEVLDLVAEFGSPGHRLTTALRALLGLLASTEGLMLPPESTDQIPGSSSTAEVFFS
eukprot:jgi/Botrbrau1/2740/Bobra.0164s0020.1